MKAIRKTSGKSFTVVAASDIAAGDIVIANGLHGVAPYAIPQGAAGTIEREGEFEAEYDCAADAAQGASAYWNATSGKVSASSSSATLIGFFAAAAASGDTVCRVILG